MMKLRESLWERRFNNMLEMFIIFGIVSNLIFWLIGVYFVVISITESVTTLIIK